MYSFNFKSAHKENKLQSQILELRDLIALNTATVQSLSSISDFTDDKPLSSTDESKDTIATFGKFVELMREMKKDINQLKSYTKVNPIQNDTSSRYDVKHENDTKLRNEEELGNVKNTIVSGIFI